MVDKRVQILELLDSSICECHSSLCKNWSSDDYIGIKKSTSRDGNLVLNK